jgi:predicted O-linked N-acetylglucosamine transferase (SPINDLY family)
MDITFDKALIFFSNGKFDNAEIICKELLEKNPESFELINLIGAIYLQQEKYDEAIIQFKKAIKINTLHPSLYNNLGVAFKKNDDFKGSIKYFEKAIELNPNYSEAYNNLGTAYMNLMDYKKSYQNYNKALELKTDYAEVYFNLGILHSGVNNFKEAITSCEKAISLKKNYIEAIQLRAAMFSAIKEHVLAIKEYGNLKKIEPNEYFKYEIQTFFEKQFICEWSGYKKNKRKIENNIKKNDSLTVHIDGIKLLSITDSLEIIKKNQENYEKVVKSRFSINKYKNFYNSKKKICIGYYSPDFRNHAVGYLISDVFKNHNKDNYQIVGFNLNKSDDSITQKISQHFDKFLTVKDSSDEEIISKSIDLKVDIAIDLCGITKDNRISIFIKRVAPIQINFLGYPGTIGTFMDYIIADKYLIPNESQKFYLEKIIYMPYTYQPFANIEINHEKKNFKKDFNLPQSGVIYGCLNNNYKINPEMFNCWMRILKKTKNSYIAFLESNNYSKENIIKEALKRNIGKERLLFFPRSNRETWLKRFSCVDIFLDTFPYGGHTTARESLMLGVPVLTLKGNSFQSNVASSLLFTLEMPELVMENIEDYEAYALYLNNNPENLKKIKEKLILSVNKSQGFNIQTYVKDLEKAYKKIYENYQKKLLPENVYIN